MSYGIKIEGLSDAVNLLEGFSERRMNAVQATALTRSARRLAQGWEGELFSSLDRPTAATLKSVIVRTASADRLQADVFVRDLSSSGGPAPVDWLRPQEFGGDRFIKKFERALMAAGAMSRGMVAVPGGYAKLDAYGNVSRGQIVDVLRQLGAEFSPGYAQVISARKDKREAASKRSGRKYVALVSRTNGYSPGIYERQGRRLLAVFVFKSGVRYRSRIDLLEQAQRDAPAILKNEAAVALADHIRRVRQRGQMPRG